MSTPWNKWIFVKPYPSRTDAGMIWSSYWRIACYCYLEECYSLFWTSHIWNRRCNNSSLLFGLYNELNISRGNSINLVATPESCCNNVDNNPCTCFYSSTMICTNVVITTRFSWKNSQLDRGNTCLILNNSTIFITW